MARTNGRMSIKEERETARSLRKSLESTHKGLQLLLESLKRSGFDQAVDSYGQMQLILMQQRLWSRSYRRNELNPLWKQIAETAGKIYAILAPIARVMGGLERIDRVEVAEDVPDLPDGQASVFPGETGQLEAKAEDTLARVLADLLVEDLSLPRSRLLRNALPRNQAQAHLQALVAKGVLEPHGWGRSRSYRLTAGARCQVLEVLTGLLQTG